MARKFHYLSDEIWADLPNKGAFGQKYVISNKGEIITYKGDDYRSGTYMKPAKINYGNRQIRLPDNDAPIGLKRPGKVYLVARLVAEYFCPRPSEDHCFVIHLDYKEDHDVFTNLKWVTKEEQNAHAKKSPRARKQVEDYKIRQQGNKLTATEVIRLKKRIADPNRKTRLKLLAKQFGISEMQLYRIKRGENWAHISV